jgi:hypothetical protein
MRVITVASRFLAMMARTRRRFIAIRDRWMIGWSELNIKNSQSRSSGLDI